MIQVIDCFNGLRDLLLRSFFLSRAAFLYKEF